MRLPAQEKRLYGNGKKQMSLKEKNCWENSSLYLVLGTGEGELKPKKKLYVYEQFTFAFYLILQ